MHGASSHEVSGCTVCSGAGTVNCYRAKYQKNGEALDQNATEKESANPSPFTSDRSADPFVSSQPADILSV